MHVMAVCYIIGALLRLARTPRGIQFCSAVITLICGLLIMFCPLHILKFAFKCRIPSQVVSEDMVIYKRKGFGVVNYFLKKKYKALSSYCCTLKVITFQDHRR